jgi:DNA-binding transcriptional ArsR family regulator
MTQPSADLIETMRVLGHPLRYKLLTLMARGPISVGEMASDTGHSLSVISQQLALMRKVGLVQARREAKLVYYSVAQNRLSNIADSLTLLSGGA